MEIWVIEVSVYPRWAISERVHPGDVPVVFDLRPANGSRFATTTPAHRTSPRNRSALLSSAGDFISLPPIIFFYLPSSFTHNLEHVRL